MLPLSVFTIAQAAKAVKRPTQGEARGPERATKGDFTMIKTDLTDRRPLATLTMSAISAILEHTVSDMEKHYKPGTMPREAFHFNLICDAYNAGFNAGKRYAGKRKHKKS